MWNQLPDQRVSVRKYLCGVLRVTEVFKMLSTKIKHKTDPKESHQAVSYCPIGSVISEGAVGGGVRCGGLGVGKVKEPGFLVPA